MIQTLYDTGDNHLVTSKMDGAVYDIACGGDCVCGGLGDEFNLNYNPSSLSVTFKSGSQAIVGGSFFKLLADETITLPANSQIALCAHIDNSKVSGQTGSIVAINEAQVKRENLNGKGNVRDLVLYNITTDSKGVTQAESKKVVKSFDSVSSYGLWVGTLNEYNALTSKSDGLIYFIVEG